MTSEPEISIIKREAEDECLLLGSDGLWDVLSSELACEIAHKCLQENLGGAGFRDVNPGQVEAGAMFLSRSASAAV